MRNLNKKGGMSIDNVIGFIWAVFSGIITLRVANPLYNTLFGALNWSNHLLLKYALQLIFGVIVFGVAFFIPFKIFTTIKNEVQPKKEYYNG